MKDVRTISRDKDFFEQIKHMIEGKTWCFIEESVIDYLKKKAGCYMTDSVYKRINFSFGEKESNKNQQQQKCHLAECGCKQVHSVPPSISTRGFFNIFSSHCSR